MNSRLGDSCYCCQNKHVDHCNFCKTKCPKTLKERIGKTSAEVIDLRKRIHRLRGLVDAIEVMCNYVRGNAEGNLDYIRDMVANYKKDDNQ